MLQKLMREETQDSFLLQYEKKKMQECADTLYNLAAAFLIEEKEEGEQERQTLFLRRRLQESRTLAADHLKEMAVMMQKAAQEKIQIIHPSRKQIKQMARALQSIVVWKPICPAYMRQGTVRVHRIRLQKQLARGLWQHFRQRRRLIKEKADF